MAATRPMPKRLAILIVVVGSALIGERLLALAAADAEVVEPAAAKRVGRSAVTDAAAAPPSVLRLDRLDARQLELSEGAAPPAPGASRPALFDSVTWQAPAVAKTAPPPPAPPPVAPPFPYAYMGGLTEDGVRTAFLIQGDRVITVKLGDTVDAAYRIDQMTEKQMTLTYLPLDQTLVLVLGGGR
ncbi:MAG: hypothetical protein V4569_08040 [Pseudomonadota bacterium]